MYKVFLLLVAISCQIGSRENLYVQIDPQTKMSKYRQWERERERERKRELKTERERGHLYN